MKDEVFEEKKRRPVDKMKVFQRIFAIVIMIIMLFSVFGTLLFYLIHK